MKNILFSITLSALTIPLGGIAMAQSTALPDYHLGLACEAMALLPPLSAPTDKSPGVYQPSDDNAIKECKKALDATKSFVPVGQTLSDNELVADLLGVVQTICTTPKTTDLGWKKRRINCEMTSTEIIVGTLSNLVNLGPPERTARYFGQSLLNLFNQCEQGPTRTYAHNCYLRCDANSPDSGASCIAKCDTKNFNSMLSCYEEGIQSLKADAPRIAPAAPATPGQAAAPAK